MAEELSKYGIDTEISENKVVIKKTKSEPKKIEPQKLVSPKETLFGHNDHRIFMALSVLLCKTGGTIKGIEAVNKTFPNFFTELKKLGAQIEIR